MWTKEFWKAALERSMRTFAQTMIAGIGTNLLLDQINWKVVLSGGAVAAILSIFMSIVTGLPEVKKPEEKVKDDPEEDDLK